MLRNRVGEHQRNVALAADAEGQLGAGRQLGEALAPGGERPCRRRLAAYPGEAIADRETGALAGPILGKRDDLKRIAVKREHQPAAIYRVVFAVLAVWRQVHLLRVVIERDGELA